MEGVYFAPIPIKYDGLDASSHEIDLGLLGISMQGAAKLIGVAGHFAITGTYVKKTPSLSVKVFVREPEAKCYQIVAYVAALQPLLPFFEDHAKVTEYIVNYILAKFGGRKSDMDRAMDVIETAIKENGTTSRAAIEAMRSTVELLADGQRPAARMFVSPVGETCATLQIGAPEHNHMVVDKAIRDAIDAPEPYEITDERSFRILLTEMDMQTRACKCSLDGSDDPHQRYTAEITDPVASLANNPYVASMGEKRWINVRGKAQLTHGDIDRLYISDIGDGRQSSIQSSKRDSDI